MNAQIDINNNTRGSRNKLASKNGPRLRPYTYSVVFAVRRQTPVRVQIDHQEHFAGGGAEPATSDPPDQAPPHPPQHPQPRHRRAARARGQHGNIIRWFGKYFKLMSYWLIIRIVRFGDYLRGFQLVWSGLTGGWYSPHPRMASASPASTGEAHSHYSLR